MDKKLFRKWFNGKYGKLPPERQLKEIAKLRVILDDFENYVKQNISSLIKTAEWFAFEDKKNLHCFWDNATHCSSAGNKIFAQRIFNLCSFKILNAEQNKNKMLTENALKALEEKHFHLTPSAFIRMLRLTFTAVLRLPSQPLLFRHQSSSVKTKTQLKLLKTHGRLSSIRILTKTELQFLNKFGQVF